MGKWKGDSNPGGPGGRTRKIQTNQPRGKTSHRAGGGKPPKKGGCAVVALMMLAVPAGLGWGLVEAVRALAS